MLWKCFGMREQKHRPFGRRKAADARLFSPCLVFLFLCVPFEAQAQSQVISARAGIVSRVEGDVWFRQSGTTGLQSLRVNQKLTAGDLVLTGSSGRVEWSLNPGSYLQVGHSSQVRIYETNLNQMHLDVERGEVFAVVAVFDKRAALVLDTPPALFTVAKRGRYRVRVQMGDETEAAVAEGELRFTDAEGKEIKVTKRRRARFSPAKRRKTWDSANSVIETPPLKGHREA